MGGFIGIFSFVVHHRIGRKTLLIGLWSLFTLRKCGGLALTRFVVSQQGVEVLRFKGFYLSFYPPTLSFPWRLVCQSKVPPRVAFFSWSASIGKILTTDNLRKKCIILLDWCHMCKRCGESVDHLLLHCPITFKLCSLVFCLFGLHWVMPHKVIESFESWQGKFKRHCNIDFWRLVPHCLMWCIWSERNARCFVGCERSLLEIKSFFLHTLLVWSVALSHFFCFSLPLLLDHRNFFS